MWKVVKQGVGYRIYQSQKRCPSVSPEIPDGWESTLSGGQYPHLITYDPSIYRHIWLSARDKQEYKTGKLIVRDGKVIEEIPASAHGCWKATRNQLLLLVEKNAYLEETYTIETYDPRAAEREEIEKAIELIRQAFRKGVIQGDKVIEKTMEPLEGNPNCFKINYDKCKFCKKLIEKTGNPYVSCLTHSIYHSLLSVSPRRSVAVIRSSDLPEDLKIDRVALQPSPSVLLAVLTKDGDALFLKKEDRPFVKLNLMKDKVFSASPSS